MTEPEQSAVERSYPYPVSKAPRVVPPHTPGGPFQPMPPEPRFWAKVIKTESCWLWTGGRSRYGYGSFRLNGRIRTAHSVAYEWLVGPLPKGLQIDHLCRNRACVNPAHMEAVTSRQNTLRGDGPTARNFRRVHGDVAI